MSVFSFASGNFGPISYARAIYALRFLSARPLDSYWPRSSVWAGARHGRKEDVEVA